MAAAHPLGVFLRKVFEKRRLGMDFELRDDRDC